MSAICIAGESGTGKTSSIGKIPEVGIEGLEPKESVYINVASKDLPFRGWKKQYVGKINEGGNYLETSNADTIAKAIQYVGQKRPDVKNIVLDDVQYILAFEFMNRAKEKSYDKFTDLGANMFKIINAAKSVPQNVFFMWHPEMEENGSYDLKTVGKMVKQYFNPKGLFTILLFSTVVKKDDKVEYKFVTNNDNEYPAKSPIGMFDLYIPNDLGYVCKKINEYDNG